MADNYEIIIRPHLFSDLYYSIKTNEDGGIIITNDEGEYIALKDSTIIFNALDKWFKANH